MGRIGSAVVALLTTCSSPLGAPRNPPSAVRSSPWPTAGSPRRRSSGSRPGRLSGCAPAGGRPPDELDRAARLVARLRLRELAGQVIVADWRGTRAPPTMVRRLHLGGVIAFSDNVESTSQIRDVNARLRRTAPRVAALPGGRPGGWHRPAGARPRHRLPGLHVGRGRGRPASHPVRGAGSGAELRGLGFTVDFAPDADVTSGPADPTIGSRSVGSDPDQVAEHAVAAAQGYLDAGVVPVLKHFPGHGSVPTDSHQGLPVQSRTLRALRRVDLVPFRAGVAAGLPAVMVGHLDVRAVDPRVPSSLSRKVVTGLLRHDLGFDGLVVTDSLEMARGQPARAGARRGAGPAGRERRGPDARRPRGRPRGPGKAVRSGALPRERLEQAAARQVALLLHGRGHAGAAPGTGRAASRALSAAAVTVVAGPCRGRSSAPGRCPSATGLGRGVPRRRRRVRPRPRPGRVPQAAQAHGQEEDPPVAPARADARLPWRAGRLRRLRRPRAGRCRGARGDGHAIHPRALGRSDSGRNVRRHPRRDGCTRGRAAGPPSCSGSVAGGCRRHFPSRLLNPLSRRPDTLVQPTELNVWKRFASTLAMGLTVLTQPSKPGGYEMVQQDAHARNQGSGGTHISRRTVARGMAWSVPVVAVATAAPAYANVSGPILVSMRGPRASTRATRSTTTSRSASRTPTVRVPVGHEPAGPDHGGR